MGRAVTFINRESEKLSRRRAEKVSDGFDNVDVGGRYQSKWTESEEVGTPLWKNVAQKKKKRKKK